MIETPAAIAKRVEIWRKLKLKIGFTSGVHDILHAGHVSTIRLAAAHCDRLIVGVDDDDNVRALKGPNRPINKVQERATVVAALKMVDAVVIFGIGELEPLIAGIAPDVLVKGDEYVGKTVVGAEHADKLLYAPMVVGISTTELVRRIREQAMFD